MNISLHRVAGLAAVLAGATAASPALAAACTGSNVLDADTTDVTFQSAAADACYVASGNAQAGPGGDPGVFSAAFPASVSPWTLIAKVDSAGAVTDSNPVPGVTFSTSFNKDSGNLTGTWALTASPGATLDLVFAMHAGGYTGSFFFDGVSAGASGSGTWRIDWKNTGGNKPDYSNLTLFAREVTPVPEPQAYALALAGLAVAGLMRRRRKA